MEAYQLLEREFAKWMLVPSDNTVACANGTAALHLALECLSLPPGSKVAVPEFAMVACARAVAMADLTPVFIDCDDSLNMNFDLVPYGDVSAVMCVHTYGRKCDLVKLTGYMDAYNRNPAYNRPLYVIEDSAEAHGLVPHPYSDAVCWSFYKNKIVSGEEGGMVYFQSPDRSLKARCLRSQGFTDAHDFYHVPRGHNYRLSNANAELVRLKLFVADLLIGRRRDIIGVYDAVTPTCWRMPYRQCPWVYDLRIPNMTYKTQDKVIEALHKIGIPARHAFKPMTSQEEFRDCRLVTDGRKESVASVVSREVVYLPVDPSHEYEKRAVEILETIYRAVA